MNLGTFGGSKLKHEEKCCRRCGRIYNYYGVGNMLCPICAEYDNAQFDKVRTYLYDNGPSSMEELAEATGVSERKIFAYLREGRLEIPPNSSLTLKCEICGADIRTGKICILCANSLSRKEHITSEETKVKKEDPYKDVKAKMRFLNN